MRCAARTKRTDWINNGILGEILAENKTISKTVLFSYYKNMSMYQQIVRRMTKVGTDIKHQAED